MNPFNIKTTTKRNKTDRARRSLGKGGTVINKSKSTQLNLPTLPLLYCFGTGIATGEGGNQTHPPSVHANAHAAACAGGAVFDRNDCNKSNLKFNA